MQSWTVSAPRGSKSIKHITGPMFKTEIWVLNYDINIYFPNCDSVNEIHYCKEITLNYLGQKGMLHATYFQVERERENEKHMGLNADTR